MLQPDPEKLKRPQFIRISVPLTPEEYKALHARASQDDVSLARTARWILQAYLNDQHTVQEAASGALQ